MTRQNPKQPEGRHAGSTRSRWLRLAELTCLTAGIGLLLLYGANRLHAEAAGTRAMAEFELAAAMNTPADSPIDVPSAGADDSGDGPGGAPVGDIDPVRLPGMPDQSLWSESRKTAFRESLSDQDIRAVGILRIPRLEIEVPIFEGTSERNLNLGVGRIEGTAPLDRPGNVGIAGHRDGYFRGLKDITTGDRIMVQGRSGETSYRVVDTLIVNPEDVHVLDPTETASITLVTCYPFYIVGHAPRRFIVRAAVADDTEAEAGAKPAVASAG